MVTYASQIGYQLPTDDIGCLCGGQPIEGFFSKLKKAAKKLDPKKRVKRLGKDIQEGSRKAEREFARNPELVGYAGMALSLVPGLQLAGASVVAASRVRQARNASKDAQAYIDQLATQEPEPAFSSAPSGGGFLTSASDWLNPPDTTTRYLRWGLVALAIYLLIRRK